MRSNRSQYGRDAVIITNSVDRAWQRQAERQAEARRFVTELRVAFLVWLGGWHFPER